MLLTRVSLCYTYVNAVLQIELTKILRYFQTQTLLTQTQIYSNSKEFSNSSIPTWNHHHIKPWFKYALVLQSYGSLITSSTQKLVFSHNGNIMSHFYVIFT